MMFLFDRDFEMNEMVIEYINSNKLLLDKVVKH